jgi:hypothetical protein
MPGMPDAAQANSIRFFALDDGEEFLRERSQGDVQGMFDNIPVADKRCPDSERP